MADIDVHRRRTQLLTALFAFISAASGVIVLQNYGEGSTLAGAVMLMVAPLCVLVAVRALRARTEAARRRVADQLSALYVVAYGAPLIFSAWGPPMANPELSAFRPIFGFSFFVYLGLIMLQPTRVGVRRLWLLFGAQLLIVGSGMYWHSGFDLQRDAMAATLLWLTVGNAFFVVLLHSLAFYARTLRSLGREAAAAQALRSSEETLQLVLYSIQAGTWGWRIDDGLKTWASPRFRELLGWDRSDADAPESVLNNLHPDDREAYAEAVTEQLQQGSRFDVNARLRRRDDSYRWFNIRGHVGLAPDGAVREVVGAILDVDDQVRSEQALADSHREMAYLAYHDVLTGLSNRRHFLERFEQELARARREQEPLSLLIVDIDHFKPYNDCYGHAAGDEALKLVAEVFPQAARRGVDTVARIGGEEFGLLLPNTDSNGALTVARAICSGVRALALPHQRADKGLLTVSAGATTLDPRAQGVSNMDLMIEEADAALYQVKLSGRDAARHYIEAVNGPDVPVARA